MVNLANAVRGMEGLRTVEVVDPPEEAQVRGDYLAWSFPADRLASNGRVIPAAWSHFRDEDGGLQRRAALVLRSTMPDGRVVASVTIEPKPGEKATYCTLLFEPPEALTPTLRRLLRLCVDRSGVWPDDPATTAALGLRRLVKWKHWSRQTQPEDAITADVTLSEQPFIRCIGLALGDTSKTSS